MFKTKGFKSFTYMASIMMTSIFLSACDTELEFAQATYRNQCAENRVIKQNHQYKVIPAHCPTQNNCDCSVDDTLVDNFGCATNHNLGVMIAHPKDLILPKRTTKYAAEPLIKAQENYNQNGTAASTNNGYGNQAGIGGIGGGIGGAAYH